MSAFNTIQTELSAGVLTITLNRPEALNALNESLATELGAALRVAQRDDAIRCIVLTGTGRGFCVGQDLKELHEPGDDADAPSDLATILRQRYNPLIVRLRTIEKPVLAAVNGVAAGAGASLALAADLRIAAENAAFILAFTNIGLVPDCAATLTLVQHVGYARAAELCFLGEPLPAARALDWGLVNRVVPAAELPGATRELAEQLAARPTRALGLTKRALNEAWTATLAQQLEYETFAQATAAKTADHREGLAAFLEKRPAKFAGK